MSRHFAFALLPDDLKLDKALPDEANLVLWVVLCQLLWHIYSLFDLVLVDVDQKAGFVGLLLKLAALAEEHWKLVDPQAHITEEVLQSVARSLITIATLPDFLSFGGRIFLSLKESLLVNFLLFDCATFVHVGFN